MEMLVWQSLILALWVGLVQSRAFFGLATLTLRFSPMMTGLVVGVVMGKIPEAMAITAAIQLIYMGVFAPGGQMPSEPCVATAVAVPIALLGGNISFENIEAVAAAAAQGTAIAVPVGLLGGYLYQFRFFLNTLIMKITDKHAANVNDAGLFRSIILYPTLAALLLYVPFMFITLQYGAPLIAKFIEANTSSVIFHILSVVGGGLASIGIAVTIYVIGKKNYLVFFMLAYFMAVVLKPLKITMVTYAIIGVVIAVLYVMVKYEAVDLAKK